MSLPTRPLDVFPRKSGLAVLFARWEASIRSQIKSQLPTLDSGEGSRRQRAKHAHEAIRFTPGCRFDSPILKALWQRVPEQCAGALCFARRILAQELATAGGGATVQCDRSNTGWLLGVTVAIDA
jgi:hypothetical protein